MRLKSDIANFRRGVEIFHTLKNKYGIAVPQMDLVVGKNEEGRARMFTVIDRIGGESLWRIHKLKEADAERFENFFIAMIQYYFDIYKNGGDYWWDFYGAQVVYGHRTREKDNQVWIVDVDPKFYTYTLGAFHSSQMPDMFSRVMECIRNAESGFENTYILKKSRDFLLKTLSKLQPDHQEDKTIIKVKYEAANPKK